MVDRAKKAQIDRLIGDAIARGLKKAGEHVLDVSNAHVPIESGDLEQSGKVSVDGNRASVSYDSERGGVIAIVQHENMQLAHDAGRTAKFLENAFNSEKDTVTEILADELRRALNQ